MTFCVLAPCSLQRKGVFFCSRASTSLTETIGGFSQQVPSCLLQRGWHGKRLFQDYAATCHRDFPFFPWWKELQRKSTHRGAPSPWGELVHSPWIAQPGWGVLVAPHELSSSQARVHQAWRTRRTAGCGLRRRHPVVKDTGFRERHPKPPPGAPAR